MKYISFDIPKKFRKLKPSEIICVPNFEKALVVFDEPKKRRK